MHWRNSNFQIAYFIAGKCHTADHAYKMLCELREERVTALNANKGAGLRRQALLRKRDSFFCKLAPWIRLEIEAKLHEAELNKDIYPAMQAQCEREIEFIEKCIGIVQPLRKYKEVPDHEAHQACQREEWRLELMDRAENFLMSGGIIPADHLDTMRAHPDWEKIIHPYIGRIQHMARAHDFSFVNGNAPFLKVLETLLLEDKS